MKKITTFFCALGLVLFVSACSKEQVAGLEEDPGAQYTSQESRAQFQIPDGAAVPGHIWVKVTDETVKEMEIDKVGAVTMQSVPTPMSLTLQRLRATNVERLFPPAGEYEKRTRQMGMHRWMIVTYDKDITVNQAMQLMSSTPGVEIVEYVPQIKIRSSENVVPMAPLAKPITRPTEMPFNDPMLSDQWHYNNTGKVPGAVAGCDIDLFKAWQIETGKKNVIVCVVDGGVDVDHPDLKDNMWINVKELNGKPGIDDDGNGYIDDINGFCFVTNSGDIGPDEDGHGTHVAGTVAARNNNGIGVCGIAGGNGDPDSGARIMTAAVFRGKYSADDFPAAIKYGADNGAVISQNSWGAPYPATYISQAFKDAIDYFNKYAGCDNDGNQLPNSPMKGGVVFFAAGNDNHDYLSSPSSYDGAVSVASVGPGFVHAWYTTYGDWVDILTPGGDTSLGIISGVLSTIDPTASKAQGQSYGYMQGTSMACPHASGIAALVVSEFGGPGFTADQLKKRLFAATAPVDIDAKNPGYEGKLGRGLLDTYLALTLEDKNIAPDKPMFLSEKMNADADFTSLAIYWKVPKDGDDGTPSRFHLYVSEKPLTAANYKTGTEIGLSAGYINALGKEVGEEMSFKLSSLIPTTDYYFAIVAEDRWGHLSAAEIIKQPTKTNHPAEIIDLSADPILVLSVSGKVEKTFTVREVDGHAWTVEMTENVKGVVVKTVQEGIKVTIRPILNAGSYEIPVTLTDELGLKSSYKIPFRIVTVTPPELKSRIPEQLLGVKSGDLTINLSEHFGTTEFLPLTYKVTSFDGLIASAKVDDKGILTVTPYKAGKTSISVTATNGYESTRTTFDVMIVPDKDLAVYSIWPIPVVKTLNARINPQYKSVTFRVRAMNGMQVLNVTVTPDSEGIARADLSKLAPGTYSLTLQTGGKPFEKVIVKK